MATSSKKERLLEAATSLFHTKGFAATSLKDIAEKADIPLGNVYYYFKSKDELGIAAAETHRKWFVAFLKNLDQTIRDPKEKIIKSIRLFDKLKETFCEHGCPVGTIVYEVSAKGSVGKAFSNVYKTHLDWLETQFISLGTPPQHAAMKSLSILKGIYGASMLSKAMSNPDIISEEVSSLVKTI